jgi:hypothetical protein
MHSLASDGNEAFSQHIADGHDQRYVADIAYLREQAAFFADRR